MPEFMLKLVERMGLEAPWCLAISLITSFVLVAGGIWYAENSLASQTEVDAVQADMKRGFQYLSISQQISDAQRNVDNLKKRIDEIDADLFEISLLNIEAMAQETRVTINRRQRQLTTERVQVEEELSMQGDLLDALRREKDTFLLPWEDE